MREAKKEYNHHKEIEEDNIIKDRRYIKIQSRKNLACDLFVEQRGSNLRLILKRRW